MPTAAIAEDVRRLASRFVDEDQDVVNRLAVTAPMQVSLRVRVAEINRVVQKQLGFNWNAVGQIGNFSLGLKSPPVCFEAGSQPTALMLRFSLTRSMGKG